MEGGIQVRLTYKLFLRSGILKTPAEVDGLRSGILKTPAEVEGLRNSKQTCTLRLGHG